MSDTAVLGGGCFWCVEAVLRGMRGILSLTPGYAGGDTEAPTYKQVCSGQTGHAEVVEVEFDPEIISYKNFLKVFFTLHDPTTLNRQGNDIGTQYRSVIFYKDENQKKTAETVKTEIEKENIWGAPLVTIIAPLTTFWPAEKMHHDYYEQNPGTGYCAAVIAPKVAKMRKIFAAHYAL
ncbi:peptide-methionine (S)-S-oxide reductase MsrA [Acetobacter tropicalis]|uniref:Peptide methionine sulfoxide reductase MsrA n=1 Tax=Acetobacter tropicalis TaxID=104102 RepID=A0A094ZFP1_9PROT|nr:peptide-methionine (S)-S-oxide reductase MsrA [Acetobacter tropicalis]KAA8389605.1 peptide-methionine (S)-S-oxide reductase MsrA [Acetobacter tropicalis]KAA8390473.1 peptide-methionine (S)-S-oxide reductase MsrA [Acetobacter tropicalis]KGB21416.1 Peptide methionine sulfoxide reductase MsrA [Acetobacter tropicalis]MBC9008463.1 peptide-methionine (S)-S-oxide reductase MsrA [Acetobacter tropicalis]MDO8173313.1 peptide-methionine (S)-S-oxide reductase MsrA [Acetobacter tropicalis]